MSERWKIDPDTRHGGFPGGGENVVFGRLGSPFPEEAVERTRVLIRLDPESG